MNTMQHAPADGYPAVASDPSRSARRKRWYRWGVGAAVFGLLAGGGITLAAVSGGTPPSSASSTQAAALNTALSDAAGNPAVPPARVRWALGRLRHLGGVDGPATFHNKTGFHTISFQRGTIASVSGGNVVIKAADGTTWAWHIVSDTVVRKDGSKTTTSALSAGQTVFAGGPVVSGTRDARLIVVRPDSAPGSSGSSGPAGSQSAQTSLS
jgi:hypothetical protein